MHLQKNTLNCLYENVKLTMKKTKAQALQEEL